MAKNILVCFFALSTILLAQKFETWQNFSNMKNINSNILENDGFWASTEGGLFHYSFDSHSFIKYTKSDGLSSQNLTSSVKDKYGKI